MKILGFGIYIVVPGWVKHWVQDETHYFCFVPHFYGSHLSKEEWERNKSWNHYKKLWIK